MLRFKPAAGQCATDHPGRRSRRLPTRLALVSILLATPGLLFAGSGPLLSALTLQSTPVRQADHSQLPALPSQAPSTALDYAHSLDFVADLRSDGRWSRHEDRAIWRLMLHSEDALNLSLTLGAIQLPDSSELRLYDADGLLWQGPYRAAELNQADTFWTPLVPGEKLLLELSLAETEQAAARLQILQLHHGYRSLDNQAKSGSCNIDVACDQADAWTDASRATARITIGGRRLCSAVLLNNTGEDGTPLLLTARHCGVEESEDYPASSVVVYWNYETSRCGGSPDGNLRQNQSGSQLLAEGSSADFTLLRLDQRPPDHYGVYYAGWDARGVSPSSGASTHHPSGDEKRISLFNQPASARRARVDGQPVESWALSWDEGITEAGSSGGGLWNQNHQVIGQLSGGNSSCDNPQGTDVFGRLDVAWDEGSEASGQLRPWLDPLGTGQLTLDGRDSRDSGARAGNDSFLGLPDDRQTLRLDVLRNDSGQWPLQIIDARAANGQVSIENNQLVYSFSPGSEQDQIEYQLIDRWGETGTAQVDLSRTAAPAPLRGGALGGWLLMILLAGIGARRWTRD